MVQAKLGNLYYNSNTVDRETSKFHEIDVKVPTAKGTTDVAVVFESGNIS